MNLTVPVSKQLILETPAWLDVRAPVEYAIGHIPQSYNVGIMNDEERDLVGKKYKSHGNQAAIELGQKLVSGEIKNSRVSHWINFLENNPGALLYCFRGGLRSKISQAWLSEAGYDVQRLEGGYKSARQFFIQQLDEISEKQSFLLISGPTGSAKTHFLKKTAQHLPTIDLEKLANHRGSAFGFLGIQPSQADFENELSLQMLRLESELNSTKMPLVLEDESRLIGKCVLPELFFNQLRQSEVIWLEVSLAERVENIFKDYILDSLISTKDPTQIEKVYDGFKDALSRISKRLGGLKTSEIAKMIQFSYERAVNHFDLDSNRDWIAELLKHYYDPMYESSLLKRNPKVVYRGSLDGAEDFLKNLCQGKKRIKIASDVSAKAL